MNVINKKILFITYLAIALTFLSCNPRQADSIKEYVPDDKGLYKTIVAMDQEFLMPIMIVI
jgi:hypothetical protein